MFESNFDAPPKEYSFTERFSVGERGEKELDRYLQSAPEVQELRHFPALERMGIDRIALLRTGERISIEYKTDLVAGNTGNVFVETMSNKDRGVHGWAETSLAQLLLYYIPTKGLLLHVEMLRVRRMLAAWEKEFGRKVVKNTNWTGEGVLVPLDRFSKLAHTIDDEAPAWGHELIREGEA